jgi:eukaryotic-like serine/threonine-protein kinase
MTARNGSIHQPDPDTPINEIFISYSRQDKAFVVDLDRALRQDGYDPWVDWSDIYPAEDWWQAIQRGIEAASFFIFVISPDSVSSKVCRQEIEYALQHNKRLVPLLWREGFSMEAIHPSISRHNWILCRETDSFEKAFTVLTTALNTDLDYVRSHSRLLVRAKEWQRKLLDKSFLLRGNDLLSAEQWLQQSRTQHPQPTALHQSYIQASREDEQARQEVELRLRQMSPQQYRNRQTLLNKVRNYWIKDVLENSINQQLSLELGLEERMDAVNLPWSLASHTAEPKRFPEGTRAIALFDQLGEGRTLLILGDPGVGKTTTLLKLARDLVSRAEQGLDDRIPVVFNLSSWTGQPIESWLVTELSAKYQIPPAIAQSWIETQQLLLLLDGLDEVKAANRDDCVLSLNLFQQQYGAEMVVCCRIHDYEILKQRLNFQQAILVRSLSLDQIQHYLDSPGSELAALRTVLAHDTVLQELAQSPLMLNLMSLVYQGKQSTDLPSLNLEDQRQYLFNSFIEQMLRRRGSNSSYSKEQVIHYLVWLAQQMKQESHSIFLIEELQPTWLSPKLRQRYRIISMGLVGLMSGISLGLFSKVLTYDIQIGTGLAIGIVAGILSGGAASFLPKLESKQAFGMISGLISAGMFGMIGRLLIGSFQPLSMSIFGVICGILFVRLRHAAIEPADTVKWSWHKGLRMFRSGLVWGLVSGGFFLMSRALLLQLNVQSSVCNVSTSWAQWTGSVLVYFVCQGEAAIAPIMLLGWLMLGLFVGLIIGLMLGFKKIPELESRTLPNHGIWKSVKNTVLLIAICGCLSTLLSALFWWIYFLSDSTTSSFIWWIYYGNHPFDGILFGLTVGVLVGLISGLVGGENSGLVILQHFVLRLVLWKNRSIPWNYAQFLNHATDLILLKKVGGGYIFIHRLLLEHFAQFR